MMEEEYSFNLDDYYSQSISKRALNKMEKLLIEQNLIGYIEGYLCAKDFLVPEKAKDKKFYDKLYKIYEEEKNKGLSLPDLKAILREYIDSYLSEKVQKEKV